MTLWEERICGECWTEDSQGTAKQWVPVPGLLGSQSQAAVCGHRTRSRCQTTEFESQEFCRQSGGSDPPRLAFPKRVSCQTAPVVPVTPETVSDLASGLQTLFRALKRTQSLPYETQGPGGDGNRDQGRSKYLACQVVIGA